MTELRTHPTKRSPFGMKLGEWDSEKKILVIRNLKTHEDNCFHLHDDGTYELTTMPIPAA